jgi:hypothetical protein
MENEFDWTLFGKAHTCLYKVPQLTVHVSKNQAMRSKELSVELRDRIMSSHRSVEGYQKFFSGSDWETSQDRGNDVQRGP